MQIDDTRPLHFAAKQRRVMYRDVPEELKPHLRWVLVALMIHCEVGGNVAWVTARELGVFCGMTRNPMQRNLAALRELGLVGPTVTALRPNGLRVFGYPILLPEPRIDEVRAVELVRQREMDEVPF